MMNLSYLRKKMRVFIHEHVYEIKRALVSLSFIGILAASFAGLFMILSEVGFETDVNRKDWYNEIISYIIRFLMLMYAVQVSMVLLPGKPYVTKINIAIKIGFLALLSIHLFDVFPHNTALEQHSGYKPEWLFNYGLVLLVFMRSWSRVLNNIYSRNIRSEKLFVFSFLFIILTGTLLLMLPVSTVAPISFTDAFFTSTSAVCVTGLSTLDTASQFTWFGKMVIMGLIQVGGIGIMTFTSFFASVGRSQHGLTEGTALSSMILSKNIKQLFSALYAVIFVTIIVELTGTMLLYFQLPAEAFPDNISRFTFALFHSVSAFCNAGFSIAPGGMMNEVFQQAYGIQMTIAWLIIIGGLGFFIVTNYMQRFSLGMKNLFRVMFGKPRQFEPNLININSRLVVTTTFWLLVLGTGVFMFFEWDGLLSGLGFGEKLATSFFCAVTPRTAGFNTIDFEVLFFPTIMLIIMLMWIGASPGSTGGGIKTTTFSVALLNAFSLGRGKEKVHFRNREISNQSVRKAFLVITFSIIFVFVATMIMSWHEPGIAIHRLLFEAFSAFGTVGLSLNVTTELSESSKYVLIFLMFVGRIGVITIFVAFIRKTRFLLFSYPEEEVFI